MRLTFSSHPSDCLGRYFHYYWLMQLSWNSMVQGDVSLGSRCYTVHPVCFPLLQYQQEWMGWSNGICEGKTDSAPSEVPWRRNISFYRPTEKGEDDVGVFAGWTMRRGLGVVEVWVGSVFGVFSFVCWKPLRIDSQHKYRQSSSSCVQ